jgi:pimeloyl-ACP methyl ester carboxylesterase
MREILIFVHGVSSDTLGRRHDQEYDALYNGVASASSASSPWRTAEMCRIEWGWNYDGLRTPKNEQLLTLAQTNLGERLLKVVDDTYDPTINPGRFVVNGFRPLMLYGFSDMFYYVSTDGKAAVRAALGEQIARFVEAGQGDPREPLSLTLIGHSAGSVIALDFCYFLFAKEHRDFGQGNMSGRGGEQLTHLRALAQEGRLRIRRLITIGSPICMLACRADAVVEILAGGGRIDPAVYGLTQNPIFFGPLKLRGPRWMNIWDKDDPIAFPVEPLVDNRLQAVSDLYINVSSNIAEAHNLYWANHDVHGQIAKYW